MAYNDDKQMFDVDLTCGKCGKHISQLPFQPSGDRPVYCADCNRAFRENRSNNDRGNFNNGPRQMFKVDLKCADCGVAITELPFQPSGDKPIYCRACLQAKRG